MRFHGSTPSDAKASREFVPFGLGPLPRFPSFPASRSYPAGVTLLFQGYPSESVLLLEQGLLKLLRVEPDGQELITRLRATGWLVGAAAAILRLPYPVTAVTATACRVSRLGADEFRRVVWSEPALSWQVHEMHSREIYAQLIQLVDVATHSARSRLVDFLHRLAQAVPPTETNGEIRIQVPLKQWELAQLLAVTPQYLCQHLGEMEREGLLRRERGTIVLLRTPSAPREPKRGRGNHTQAP